MTVFLRSWSALVLFVIFAVCHGQQDLILAPSSDQYLELGSLFSFTCESVGPNKFEYPIWVDPAGMQVHERGSGGSQFRYTEADGRHIVILFFDEIQGTHAGTYSCKAGGLSKSVGVQIYKGIEFTDAPTEQFVTKGEVGFITCVVTGNPTPTVQWKFNDDDLPLDGRFTPAKPPDVLEGDDKTRYQETGGLGLTITNVTLQDEGTYTCRARMPTLGYTEKVEILVDVLVHPYITQGPHNTTGDEGKSARFTCYADGDPLPAIVWYFHGDPVQNPIKYQLGDNGRTLTIQNLEEADSGRYECRAENTVSFVTESAFLGVNVKPVIGPGQNETKDEKEFVSFTCKVVRGTPTPTVRWRRALKYYQMGVQPDDDRINVYTNEKQELVLSINNLNRFDIGAYTCVADNIAGFDEQDFLVNVMYKPVVEEAKTLRVQKSWFNNPTNVTCVISSNPTAEYTWDRNTRTLNFTTHFIYGSKTGTSLFIIPDRTDFGDYRCSAFNRLGNDKYVVTLEQTYVPDPPQEIEKDEIYPTSITLKVVDPEMTGGWPIDGYKVQITEGEFKRLEDQEFQKGQEIDVVELRVNTVYRVKVACHNPVGYSFYSEEIIFTTLDYRQPYEPTITSAPATQMGTKYNLQWITPKDGGMDIRFYEVRHRELFFSSDGRQETKGVWRDKSGIPNYSTDYLIENLRPETSYDVELYAINSIARGDVAMITITTGRVVPTVGPTKPNLVDRTLRPPGKQIGAAGLTTGAIIGIVLAVFFLLLIVVDVSCYCMNDCGLLMCLCVNLCGKTPPGELEMEEGRKVPPSDDKVPDGNAVKREDMPMEKIEPEKDSTEKPPPEDSFDSEGKANNNPEETPPVEQENTALTPDKETVPDKGPHHYEEAPSADVDDVSLDIKREVQA